MDLIKGYIPYKAKLNNKTEKIIIISHGLGSSMESPTGLKLTETIDGVENTGYIAYDFTSHGKNYRKEHFGVKSCIEDLKNVYEYAKEKFEGAKIYFFGSSFGAYITLLFLNQNPNIKTKAFLRSAAVTFPKLILDNSTKEQEKRD